MVKCSTENLGSLNYDDGNFGFFALHLSYRMNGAF